MSLGILKGQVQNKEELNNLQEIKVGDMIFVHEEHTVMLFTDDYKWVPCLGLQSIVYYAHCISLYNTQQEKRDLEMISLLFPSCTIDNPNNEEYSKKYSELGMDFFKQIVKRSSLVVFRALPNGKIPAGVWKEIMWAQEDNIPVIELPCFTGREMSVDDTRLFIKEIGYR